MASVVTAQKVQKVQKVQEDDKIGQLVVDGSTLLSPRGSLRASCPNLRPLDSPQGSCLGNKVQRLCHQRHSDQALQFCHPSNKKQPRQSVTELEMGPPWFVVGRRALASRPQGLGISPNPPPPSPHSLLVPIHSHQKLGQPTLGPVASTRRDWRVCPLGGAAEVVSSSCRP